MMLIDSKTLPLKILAGSGRCGTTWLLDVLCEANELHPVFEPLHPEGWKFVRNLSRRYAFSDKNVQQQVGSDLHEMEALWDSLLTGNYPSTWIDFRVRPDKLRPRWNDFMSLGRFKPLAAQWAKLLWHRSKYRRHVQAACLIKVIRANLLLPQIVNRLDTDWALVMRHPAAVVESQLRIGGDWNAQDIAAYYSGDKGLAARLGCDWSHWTSQMRSDTELFTLIWCLENTLPLEDVDRAQERVVFYEKLDANDAPEWNKLLDGLALQQMPNASALLRPSQQSSKLMGRAVDARQPSALDRLNPVDRDGIQRVLDLVGVSFYHTGSLMPELGKLMDGRPWLSG